MRTPYIVAELSCNHLGSLTRCLDLVDAAAEAGADAVKLQCWSPERMSIDNEYVIPSGPWAGYTLPRLYGEAFTPWGWFEPVFARARDRGVEAFASVFDTDALAFLESIGCPRYKIASFEITDLPLIEAVARTGKPIVISTGMARWEDIVAAKQAARGYPVTYLKCTSGYPAPVTEANLLTLCDPVLRAYGQVGLSDHTLGSTVAIAATALGATMIEKHLILSRADGGPDAGFSSEPHEFKAMVSACREAAAALGIVRYGPTDAERTSLIYRRSLYARRTLRVGEEITPIIFEGSVQSSRPALGLPPDYPIIGRRMAHNVMEGRPITEADLAD